MKKKKDTTKIYIFLLSEKCLTEYTYSCACFILPLFKQCPFLSHLMPNDIDGHICAFLSLSPGIYCQHSIIYQTLEISPNLVFWGKKKKEKSSILSLSYLFCSLSALANAYYLLGSVLSQLVLASPWMRLIFLAAPFTADKIPQITLLDLVVLLLPSLPYIVLGMFLKAMHMCQGHDGCAVTCGNMPADTIQQHTISLIPK